MNVLSSPRTTSSLPKSAGDEAERKPLREQLAMLFGVGVPFVGLVAAIALTWNRAVGWFDIGLLLGFYLFTCLGVTIGFHGMFTHRSLQGRPVVRFILGVAGSMSAQGPLLEWCAIHRQDHKHSDRDGDPHSPWLRSGGWGATAAGMWHAHVGWLFARDAGERRPVVPDLLGDPVLCVVDRFFWAWMMLGWLAPAMIEGVCLRSWAAAFHGFLWGGLVRTFLLHHVTWSINSVCHIWGTRVFDTPDHSRNNFLFGLLALGEGWHNNHHAFPTSARHGLHRWQIDLTYCVICAMQWCGLVWQVRVPSGASIAARRGLAAEVPNA